MTQELDKEGLEAAIKRGEEAYYGEFSLDYIIEKSTQAYLNTAKVTGFDVGLMKDAIATLEDLGACNNPECNDDICLKVLPRLKAALAGIEINNGSKGNG